MMKKTILVLSLSVLLATSSFAPFIGSNNNIISFLHSAYAATNPMEDIKELIPGVEDGKIKLNSIQKSE